MSKRNRCRIHACKRIAERLDMDPDDALRELSRFCKKKFKRQPSKSNKTRVRFKMNFRGEPISVVWDYNLKTVVTVMLWPNERWAAQCHAVNPKTLNANETRGEK